MSTPFGAVVRTGQVGIGESVGVWGVGGVGTHIVQLARLVGAVPVIAVDIKSEVLDRAVELGADYTFDAHHDRLNDKIADIIGGRKLDVAFDAVGLKSTFEQGHLGYQNVDIETLATLVSRGRLDLSRSISDVVSLEDVRVGIEKLDRQEGNPIRILVKP